MWTVDQPQETMSREGNGQGLATAVAKMAERRSYVEFTGRPLPSEMAGGLRSFVGCLCVHAEGCPCDWPIVFFPPDIPIPDPQPTGERNKDGEPMYSIRVPLGAHLLVSTTTEMTAEEASDGGLQAVAKKGAAGNWVKGKAINTAASIAFGVGYWVGTQIDEETGLSDSVSDWLADNVPAPDWLKDLF